MAIVYIVFFLLWVCVIAAYLGILPMPNANIGDDGSSHF
jgi:hypothetical protein